MSATGGGFRPTNVPPPIQWLTQFSPWAGSMARTALRSGVELITCSRIEGETWTTPSMRRWFLDVSSTGLAGKAARPPDGLRWQSRDVQVERHAIGCAAPRRRSGTRPVGTDHRRSAAAWKGSQSRSATLRARVASYQTQAWRQAGSAGTSPPGRDQRSIAPALRSPICLRRGESDSGAVGSTRRVTRQRLGVSYELREARSGELALRRAGGTRAAQSRRWQSVGAQLIVPGEAGRRNRALVKPTSAVSSPSPIQSRNSVVRGFRFPEAYPQARDSQLDCAVQNDRS
jgi:hypothetical protein